MRLLFIAAIIVCAICGITVSLFGLAFVILSGKYIYTLVPGCLIAGYLLTVFCASFDIKWVDVIVSILLVSFSIYACFYVSSSIGESAPGIWEWSRTRVLFIANTTLLLAVLEKSLFRL